MGEQTEGKKELRSSVAESHPTTGGFEKIQDITAIRHIKRGVKHRAAALLHKSRVMCRRRIAFYTRGLKQAPLFACFGALGV